MDQKRLMTAIALSLVIVVLFQFLMPAPVRHTPPGAPAAPTATATAPTPSSTIGAVPQDAGAAPIPPPREVPRLRIDAPRIHGSISLIGARIDDVVLPDYRETLDRDSPLVRVLEPKGEPQPYYAQFGWSAAAGSNVKVPGNDTLWTADGDVLTPGHPVTLSWDNGAGQTFTIALSIDDNFMLVARQGVRNSGPEPVTLIPWSRIRRDYTPKVAGYSVLHEGLIGVLDGSLKQITYSSAKSEAEKADAAKGASNGGEAQGYTATGGWAGITDKYWLAALIPDQTSRGRAAFRHTTNTLANGTTADGYQVDFRAEEPVLVPAGGEVAHVTRLFAGAKEVHLLDRYQHDLGIPSFDTAVDFGHLYFLTKPFFLAIDWIYQRTGNFGVAILIFTFFLKLLFFPLANRSYRSMARMKALQPKMTALREQYKDEPQKLQQSIMQLYKTEKVNPASGCLPMLLQIPVFFALYKVIFVTIEMRQAPFFGWVRDLSAVDPTNVFNLFGLIPFDPAAVSPLLHLSAWSLIMGGTMYLQQRMNPTPPDPTQARLFQFMPILFTFMMAGFPAGLVIYWSWNNLLTFCQQWLINRRAGATPRAVAQDQSA